MFILVIYKYTRTTVHYVDSGIDTGEIICLGPFLEFTGDKDNDSDILKHEQLQKKISDKPALIMAMNLYFASHFSKLNL